MHFPFVALFFVTTLTPLMVSAAQPAATTNPAAPDAPTPTVNYASAFASYRPLRDEPLASWREVNDEVARVGGHIGMFGGAHAGHGVKPAPATAPGVPK